MKLGFDAVFEVARGAEFVSRAIREYLAKGSYCRPAISSACPAVVRLIQVNFPELIDHLVPFCGADRSRCSASQRTGSTQRGAESSGYWRMVYYSLSC